jgi:D-3-phosphoglycerate dehydrogenase / 2-oxoglutarate reductase
MISAQINQCGPAVDLHSGSFGGARDAFDVLATEPPHQQQALPALPNVIVTPHAGFYSEQSLHDLTRG